MDRRSLIEPHDPFDSAVHAGHASDGAGWVQGVPRVVDARVDQARVCHGVLTLD